MKCQAYVSLMSDYLNRELAPEDRELWEKHFQDCPPCHSFFESFKTSVELLEYLRRETCPKAVAERLDRLIHEKAKEKAASRGERQA